MQKYRPSLASLTPLLLLAALQCYAPAGQAEAADATGGKAVSQQQARQILEEFREIRKLLESIENKRSGGKPSKPATARVSTRGRPAAGSPDAPVTVIEFADYHSPDSQRFNRTTFTALKGKYIDSGRLRWVVIDLPSPSRTYADKAAQAAHCAGAQGGFWAMRASLFENPGRLAPEQLPAHAEQIGIDMKGFMACLYSKRYLDDIASDAQTAKDLGLTRFPVFIVGKTTSDMIEGKLINGAPPLQQFEAAIDSQLRKPPANRKAAAGK